MNGKNKFYCLKGTELLAGFNSIIQAAEMKFKRSEQLKNELYLRFNFLGQFEKHL